MQNASPDHQWNRVTMLGTLTAMGLAASGLLFKCTECGHTADRDWNAVANLLGALDTQQQVNTGVLE